MHRSSDSNKLEVVHIPIRKANKKPKDSDWEFDESQLIPVTFSPDLETTPLPSFYYKYPNDETEPISFESDDENEKFSDNDIYNEHFKNRNDEYTEKNFYKNHVHSPFI